MNKSIDGTQWNEYLKTPARKSSPVKLEHILEQRIEAFLRAKRVKSAQSQKR